MKDIIWSDRRGGNAMPGCCERVSQMRVRHRKHGLAHGEGKRARLGNRQGIGRYSKGWRLFAAGRILLLTRAHGLILWAAKRNWALWS